VRPITEGECVQASAKFARRVRVSGIKTMCPQRGSAEEEVRKRENAENAFASPAQAAGMHACVCVCESACVRVCVCVWSASISVVV
jgi:hypothetical protein